MPSEIMRAPSQDSDFPDDLEIVPPPVGSLWGHSNGDTYTVTGYADMFSNNHQRRPPRVIYRSTQTGRIWSRELSEWYGSHSPAISAATGEKG